jgi:hypothetical protein
MAGLAAALPSAGRAQSDGDVKDAYLFTSFRGNGDGLHLALQRRRVRVD